MRKSFKISIIAAILALAALPTQATSEAKLTTDVPHITETTVWEEKEDAPGLKIIIKDAYKRAGKTEKVILTLKNATWTDGNGSSLQIYDGKNIETYKIAIMGKSEDCVQLNVDIPSDIKEGEEISFVVPLLVKIRDKEEAVVSVEGSTDSELIDAKDVLFGGKSEKKVTWEVGKTPTIVKEGNIVDITFTELRPCIIDDELEVTLRLQNSNLAFGDFDYNSEDKHSADTDYTLSTDKYVIYGGGFTGLSETMKLKKYNKDDQVITLKIRGKVSSEKGSITLTNIPIINKSSNFKEEDVKLSLEGDAITNAQKDIVVAYIRNKTEEELAEQEKAQLEAEIEKEEAKKQEKEAQRGIQFVVGESFYSINGEKYEMDAKSYIQNPGYIMVPLKYVGVSLGIPEESIQYNSGLIYFKYNGKVIELRAGSDIARVNKVNIQMEAPVVIKDGRSYAPMGEVARLLGLERQWDSTTKKAIFKVI